MEHEHLKICILKSLLLLFNNNNDNSGDDQTSGDPVWNQKGRKMTNPLDKTSFVFPQLWYLK